MWNIMWELSMPLQELHADPAGWRSADKLVGSGFLKEFYIKVFLGMTYTSKAKKTQVKFEIIIKGK